MKNKFLILAFCLMAMMLLTGCLGSGGGSSGSGSSYSGSSGSGDSGGGGDVVVNLPHSPEPATLALLGGGLAAYAFLKRKKKK